MENLNVDADGSSAPTGKKIDRRLPGIEGIWVFVFADMTMFAIMFACFMTDRQKDLKLFEQSRQALNQNFGGINTLILLTSSMLVVLAIDALKLQRARLAQKYLLMAQACGVAFMIIKGFEYGEKFKAGISLLSNNFYMYYFVLTGIHLFHVIAGTIVLAVLWFRVRSTPVNEGNLTICECGAIYWHMVDLLWVYLFALLYLVR